MIWKASAQAVIPTSGQLTLPPLYKRAINYAKATKVAARQVVQGKPVRVSPEEAQRRVEYFCKGHSSGEICPFYRCEDGKCAKCGCPVRARARRAALGCPRGLW
jgi:hypothetical protein